MTPSISPSSAASPMASPSVPGAIDRFRALPRAMRWLIVAAAFSVIALVWANIIDPARESLANQSARIEQDVAAIQAGQRFLRELENQARRRQIVLLGPVSLPSDEQAIGERMSQAVVEILERHNTRVGDLRRNQGRRMPQTVADTLTGSSDRVVRLTLDLRFEAETETASDIIRDLEAHQHINAITSISMAKAGGRRLQISVVVESWYREAQTFG